MSVVKPKPKYTVVTPGDHNNYKLPMNQSELEANTRHRLQVWEDTCKQVTVGLSFTFDWSRKWCKIF